MVLISSRNRNCSYPPNKVVKYSIRTKSEITCPSCGTPVADYPTLDAHLLQVHPGFMASVAEMIEDRLP
jgi:hypothetical protein